MLKNRAMAKGLTLIDILAQPPALQIGLRVPGKPMLLGTALLLFQGQTPENKCANLQLCFEKVKKGP